MSVRFDDVELSDVPEMVAELTTIICLAPCLIDDQPSARVQREGRELANAIRRILGDLEEFLTPDVREDIESLLDHVDRNRDRYRRAVLLWVDLLEEVAALMEKEYGNDTGPLKKRRVRAAMYYLLKGFIGNTPLPRIPTFLRPIALELAIRGTIEFLVSLDHRESDGKARPKLWDKVERPQGPKSTLLETRVKLSKPWDRFLEVLGTWVASLFFSPPWLWPPLRKKVNAILADWQVRNRETGTTPAERTFGVVMDTARWIGEHGPQVRALIDMVAVAVCETAKMARLSRDERLDVVKEAALIIVQEDLGFSGPLWGTIMRLMVDLMADAIENLFRKRGLIEA
jgi:hypothetical protein